MQFPHCDARVLHAPGECEYCDGHEEWQKLRETWDISFTGHNDKLVPCPADMARGDGHMRWGGNLAVRDGQYLWPPVPQEQVQDAMQGLLFIIEDTSVSV